MEPETFRVIPIDNPTQIPLKILVDKDKNKVLFAEADYTFVDILFGFMTLPMGTIVQLVGSNSDSKLPSIGSFNTLYEGLANLPSECFWSEECKAVLLNPINSSESYCSLLKLNVEDTLPTKYYCICQSGQFCPTAAEGGGVFSVCKYEKCSCGSFLSFETNLLEKSNAYIAHGKEGTFVTERETFIITDNLLVMHNSLGSSTGVLNDLGIEDLTSLEEMTKNIGILEVLNLLRLALFSNCPLTKLFLPDTQTTNHELLKHKPVNITWSRVDKETPAGNSKRFKAKAFLRNSNGKLLFVQAGGDLIDFLFSFLAIPLGTVEWLSSSTNIPPSIDNLYTSLSTLNDGQYMKSQDLKNLFRQPPLSQQYMCKNQLFTLKEATAMKYYLEKGLTLKDPKLEGEFVRGTTLFMVTDNLIATPFSSISAISYLSKLKVPLPDLAEHEVSIGVEEGLGILKASLTSSSASSDGLHHLLLKKPKQEN